MKALGITFNAKRIFSYYILLIFGFSLMAFGVLSFYGDQRTFNASLTDDEIIIRAKALGMVEMKSTLTEAETENEAEAGTEITTETATETTTEPTK